MQVKLEGSHFVNACIVNSGWYDKIVTDAAQILSIDDLCISSLTPADTPRVLSDPVIHWTSGSSIGTPADNQKVMFELDITFGASVR